MPHKQTPRRYRAMGAALAMIVVGACGGGGGGSTPAPTPTPTPTPTPPPVNRAPAFTSAASFSLLENSKAVGVVTATDADGDALTYALAGGADALLVAINPATGALSLRPCAVNFESPGDANADNTYEVTLSASDGKATTTQGVRIGVTNVVEPTIGSGLLVRFAATDRDAGSFSSGGDIDCDGFPETLVTSGSSATRAGIPIPYDVYVLFGDDLRKKSNETIQLPDTTQGAGPGVRIRGVEKTTSDFRSASFAGDVDGDGLGDLVVSSRGSDQVYVIFGDAILRARQGGGSIDVDTMALGKDGVLITGVNRIVTGLGDVDGDALDDIAFGGHFVSDHYFVVFGSALKAKKSGDGNMAAVQLAGSGAGVEMTYGDRRIEFNRTEVLAPAGDVDGDGLADLAIGAVGSAAGGYYSGEAFIVLGAALKAAASTPGAIDLTAIEARGQGMRIVGASDSLAGAAVAGLGRLDADPLGEVIVGSPGAARGGSGASGQVAVVRGATLKAAAQAKAPISWASLAADGSSLIVSGPVNDNVSSAGYTGWAAAPAGDVDGDNLPDLVIGSPFETNGSGGDRAGSAYILFGSGIAGRTTLDLAAIPSSAVAVKIIGQRDAIGTGHLPDMLYMGGLLAPLGDLDGDGLDEIAVGQDPEDSSVGGGSSRVGRSGVFIISGARMAQAKAAGGPIRLRDMIR